MRKIITILLLTVHLTGCISKKNNSTNNESVVYENQYSERLELYDDGNYVLWNSEATPDMVIEQCDYASKGRWSKISNDILELTSEDHYITQDGFTYQLNKENKFSKDSLYIKVNFPTDFHPVELYFSFNYNVSKSIITDKTFLALSKKKYLKDGIGRTNEIGLNLNAKVTGTNIYRSRIMFHIFEDFQENIDTDKYNYLTITLPYFDRCFFEFEPYLKDFIYIKNNDKLMWHGEVWNKLCL